jgi:hypothetical protein
MAEIIAMEIKRAEDILLIPFFTTSFFMALKIKGEPLIKIDIQAGSKPKGIFREKSK